MTGAELISEIKSRGFDYVSNARILRWINVAYQRINNREAWPFLETLTTVSSVPTTISNLRAVLSVTDTTRKAVVEFEDIRTIRDRDPDLSATGNPSSWYINESGDFTTYPESTNDLSVLYLQRPDDVQDGTSPLWPDAYHYLLADAAVTEAYKDTDNWEGHNNLVPIVDDAVEDMKNDLLVRNYDNPVQIAASHFGSTDW